MKRLYVDIMDGERFVGSMTMDVDPAFWKVSDVANEVKRRFPASVKQWKDIVLHIDTAETLRSAKVKMFGR